MSKVVNTVVLRNGYVEVYIKSNIYRHTMLLDTEDLALIGKVRVGNTGYAYQANQFGKAVAHVLMNHTPSRTVVVDHINGNRLDNRKFNLRIITQQENTQARRTFIRNNTGTIGISYRENGNYSYYRVSLTSPVTGARFTKQFNINKLGKKIAFSLATTCLAEMKSLFNYCE